MTTWERHLVGYLSGDDSSLDDLAAAARDADDPADARTWLALLRTIDGSGRATPPPGPGVIEQLTRTLAEIEPPSRPGSAEGGVAGAPDDDDDDDDIGLGAALERIAAPTPGAKGLADLLARLRDDDVAAPFARGLDDDAPDDVSPITGVDFSGRDVPDVKAAGKDMEGDEEESEGPRD